MFKRKKKKSHSQERVYLQIQPVPHDEFSEKHGKPTDGGTCASVLHLLISCSWHLMTVDLFNLKARRQRLQTAKSHNERAVFKSPRADSSFEPELHVLHRGHELSGS